MNEAGLVCICAFLAPDADVRSQGPRRRSAADRFFEIHLSAPIEVCRQRDTEGMYAKADAGEIVDFPGVSAPYDVPKSPDLVLPTHELPVAECVARIMRLLEEKQIVT